MEVILLLSVCVFLFLILPFLLHSNSALVFLALCTGELLSSLAGGDATNISKSVMPHSSGAADASVALFLLCSPVLFVLLTHRLPGKAALRVVGIVPGICAAVLGMLLMVPKLTAAAQSTIVDTQIYQQLIEYKIICLVLGVSMTMFLLFLERPRHFGGHRGSRHA